ncbi:hypothetical protein, partial [Caldibacillus thermoamylovorans]|uniref:hypothetical protein n=1 Tax=Caldibacillus thermoamylovorans TaxID=35841 RepID=UPI000B26B25B
PNGDEIYSRRQKRAFSTSKRRRELVSSPKVDVFRLKSVTRMDLVAKSWCFSTQNSDENGSRRQKMKLSVQKRRRERASSPKNEAFRPKTTTKIGLVVKIRRFSPQNGDEIGVRRLIGFLRCKT